MERPELEVLRTPNEPYCIEAEEAVLGGILHDPEALGSIVEVLGSEHFYVESHKILYSAMVALHVQGRPPAPILLLEHLRSTGKLDAVGGGRQLRRLQDGALHAIAIDTHALLLREKWKRRRVLQVFKESYRRALDPEVDLDELLGECAGALAGVSMGEAERERPLGELLVEYFEHLERLSQSGQPPGVSTGYYDLDRLLGNGLQQDTLTYVAAAPAMGKTAWVLNLLLAAARQGVRCLFFSLEMGRNSLMARILGTEAEIASHRLSSGRLSNAEWQRVGRTLGELSQLGVDVSLAQGLKASDIANRTRLWMAKNHVDAAKCLVAVDHLTLVRPESGKDDTRISVGRSSGIFRELKNEMHIPLVVLSQLNREVAKRANKRPTLVDLQETARLEQDADVVLGLYRDEYYNPDTPERGIAEVLVLKDRNGPTGTVKLLFEDQFARFLNLASRQ